MRKIKPRKCHPRFKMNCVPRLLQRPYICSRSLPVTDGSVVSVVILANSEYSQHEHGDST